MKIFACVMASAALAVAGSAQAGEMIAGVTPGNRLVTFDSAAPGSSLTNLAITGLNASDKVLGLDFRPQTGEVIAIGETNQLYSLNIGTGAATPIGAGFAPALSGSPFFRFGIDINPTVDRVRVVGGGLNSENRRLNPVTGDAAAQDTNLSFAPGVGFGQAPRAVGVAYTNSIANAPVGSTREFVIDSLNNSIGEVGTQAGGNPSFNAGVITSAFAITLGGMAIDFNNDAGFDISGATGIAYASLNLQTAPIGTPTGFYSIDLSNGQATLLGLSEGDLNLRDFTVIPVPAPGGVALMGLGGAMCLRRRRR